MCARNKIFDESIELKKNAMLKHRPELFYEWDFGKNDELGLDVYKVTYGSGKRAWWICERGHSIDAFIYSRVTSEGYCRICSNHEILVGFNDMWTTNPELANQLLDPEDGYKYTQNSSKKVDWKCLECSNILPQKSINNTKRVGLSCPICSDGIPFGEKFIYHILKDNGIKFELEKTFSWSQKRRYDFYLPTLSCIIEVHGEQHATGKFRNTYVRDEAGNDKLKRELALKNGIEEYIVIDAEKSYGDYIMNSILNLSSPYKIWLIADFNDIEKRTSQTLMKDAWNLWNEGNAVGEIVEELRLSRPTIRKYLKRGAFAGVCDYSTEESRKRSGRVNSEHDVWNVPIVQFDKEMNFIKEWRNATHATKELNISSSSSIHSCCKGENKTAGGFRWLYKDYYDKNKEKELNTDITHKGRSIIQLNQQGEFIKAWASLASAERELGITTSGICSVCIGKQRTAGGFMWAYEEDYHKGILSRFTEKRKHKRKFVQLDKNMNALKLWDSLTEASKSVGLKKTSGIILVCQGKQKTSGGFKWMYKEDYEREFGKLV